VPEWFSLRIFRGNRLDMAMKNGADAAIDSGCEPVPAAVRRLTGSRGVDLSLDAAGLERTVRDCIDSTRLGGQVVFVGNLAKTVGIPFQDVITHELTLYGSCASAGEYPACLALIGEGKVDVEALISKTVPLEEGAEWIKRVHDREEGLYKLMLTMGG